MLKFAYMAAALMLAPAPAFAQIVFDDNGTTAAPAKPALKSDLDKIVCRMQDTIGSRVQAHKVCLTKQQWFQAEQDEKNKVKELQDFTRAPVSNQ
ncbi:MAG: hypothetical protein ACM3ZV_03355 [Bacillota bacterium]